MVQRGRDDHDDAPNSNLAAVVVDERFRCAVYICVYICVHVRHCCHFSTTNVFLNIIKRSTASNAALFTVPSISFLAPTQNRSLNSVLSDLPDARHQPTDFAEGMAMIYDALHPADFDEEHCGGGGCDDESSSSSMRTMMIPPPPPPMTMTAAPGAATTSAFRLSSCFRRNGISTRVVDDGRQ